MPGFHKLALSFITPPISPLQSIISVYLLAMWALTYFGQPFE